jgi:hypothetical protein
MGGSCDGRGLPGARMNYFLVNNDYQYYDALLHLPALRGGAALIRVPHNLKRVDKDACFSAVLTIMSPFAVRGGVLRLRRIFRAQREVERTLPVTSGDTLLLYTEFEVLNQAVVRHFKRRGARVVLIEDGGIATFLTFNIQGARERKSLVQAAAQLWLQSLAGAPYLTLVKYNGIIFPQIQDRYIDVAVYYLPMPISRSIRRIVVRKPVQHVEGLARGTAIFLNERVYDYYCTMEKYLEFLERILTRMEQGFTRVLFKFHPSETPERRSMISAVLARHPAVARVDNDAAVETLVQQYMPGHAVSFLSSALLNLWYYGVQPVFLYRLMPEMEIQRIFRDLEGLLNGAGCRTPGDFSEVEAGFTCGMVSDGDAEDSLQHALDRLGTP